MSNPPTSSSTAAFDETRRQVAEVQNVMKQNVEKVLERDGKLSDLENRAEHLQEGSKQFNASAVRVKRKMFWEDMKMKIIIGSIVTIVIIAIIIWASS